MTDPTRAAYESALHKLNELSERLTISRENDDYLHRLANTAQNVAIAAREVCRSPRKKSPVQQEIFFAGMGGRKYGTEQTYILPGQYTRTVQGGSPPSSSG